MNKNKVSSVCIFLIMDRWLWGHQGVEFHYGLLEASSLQSCYLSPVLRSLWLHTAADFGERRDITQWTQQNDASPRSPQPAHPWPASRASERNHRQQESGQGHRAGAAAVASGALLPKQHIKRDNSCKEPGQWGRAEGRWYVHNGNLKDNSALRKIM